MADNLFQADKLFSLREVGEDEGMPLWANLRASRQKLDTATRESLCGPGIYAAFFDGNLFYVGIYAGVLTNPFGGSVLDRWQKHILGHSFRARDLSLTPRRLAQILTGLEGVIADGLAKCVSPDWESSGVLDPGIAPLRKRGIQTTYNKAIFAARNWRDLAPGREATFLENFSFLYWRLEASGATDKESIKRLILRPLEDRLVGSLKPICNSQTAPVDARWDVTVDEVRTVFGEISGSAAEFAADRSIPSRTAEVEVRDSEDDEPAAGENRMRSRLSEAGEAFLSNLFGELPGEFSNYFTDSSPQARIKSKGRDTRVLMWIMSAAGARLTVRTLASVDACASAGFDAQHCPPSEKVMATKFNFDPGVTAPTQIYDVLRSAAGRVR